MLTSGGAFFIIEEESKKNNADSEKEEKKRKETSDLSSAESADWSGEGSSSSEEASSSDGDDTDDSSGLFFAGSKGPHALEEAWGEGLGDVPVADQTSRRIAVCNMDWDHIEAQGVYGQSEGGYGQVLLRTVNPPC